jgi:hypothetical protein
MTRATRGSSTVPWKSTGTGLLFSSARLGCATTAFTASLPCVNAGRKRERAPNRASARNSSASRLGVRVRYDRDL